MGSRISRIPNWRWFGFGSTVEVGGWEVSKDSIDVFKHW